ncbi:peptidase S10, serine carboxypeptidase [Gloeophyllum trabeum ATCC 11539]|uniref:Peptidase S10, serine carboxypeptidase n=1 Tax=Gloeophyllum trabeum (strain ATCC 11539 / FP-39264 / Madison 617) TaxID=670483 RepID=S7S5L5_GLOTA|nr:peptidase S10, serine carboxypeptidase [Gloeophyllum trabeum ATCC 11539]EPQ61289.1 peptidase S10, serine carboxypeptidase [Gloeophyllum trabeum ATCC 11539]
MFICEKGFDKPYYDTGLNPYDMNKMYDGPCAVRAFCLSRGITKYLDRPEIPALGVDPSVPQNYSMCSEDVSLFFYNFDDRFGSTTPYVHGLLERGVHVLVYVGTYDCSWVGNERWTLALEWSGQPGFMSTPLRNWQGKVAGRTRSASGPGLTFATIDEAGHMAPYDKPRETLQVVNGQWMRADALRAVSLGLKLGIKK